MPAVTFNLGSSVAGFPALASMEAWWYKGTPAQPWVRAQMPEPTVSFDQADTLIFWGFDRTNLRGNLLNPDGGLISTTRFGTLKEAVEFYKGTSTVSSPQQILGFFLDD